MIAVARPGRTIAALSLASLGVHVAVNALGGYGYFRDELYYIACSRHLDAGYVDQPPLSIWLLALARGVLGTSVFAIRLVPAILSALSTALVCLLARRMGGGWGAMILGGLCFLVAPQLLGFHAYYSMNSLDILVWLMAAHALLALVERATLGRWAGLGIILGLGLLNKISVLWLGAGVLAAILFTSLRRELRKPGPYVAGLLALVIFAPYLTWNARLGFPHLEFMRNATANKYSSLTRLRFLADQLRAMNPLTFLVSLPGLAWCLAGREGRRYRVLGASFLAVFGILLANTHTKSEYVAAAYPALFACGGVAVERLSRTWPRVAVPALAGLLVSTGALLAPIALPILPVESYIRYAQRMGVAPSTPENQKLSRLPQFFADMHGWEELAEDVSRAYRTIPEAERKTTVAFVTNYGEAGALELYSRKYPLPRVICNHNSYWLWGVGPTPITTFIRLGGRREDYLESYEDVTASGIHTCRYAMPYEDDLGIFIARKRRVPIERAWGEYRHFE
ncbi:MAG: ArnT family glycosyltransferase [Thermoanaerobaculia bacterium]